ncbi:unnamed protein product [Orchesella dallaii]|uniref:Ionotropic glutamate receptor C-terminal domain-containing protein n=1 Tax=Orchesella dallaii TaxID=48710 RepID=A0ABP1QVJ4_9HEXA
MTQIFLTEYKSKDKYLLSYSNSTETSSFEQVSDVHKLRKHCVLAFVQVKEVNLIEKLYNLLTLFDGVLEKDEDYFLFHSMKEEVIRSSFISGPLALGVKNKVGISITNQTISYHATCFYCDAGKPTLYSIGTWLIEDVYDKEVKLHFSTLFPDFLQNFHGKMFTVSSPTLATWLNEIREVSPGRWKNVRGVMNFCFEHLAWKYNFTSKFFPSIGGGGTGYYIRSNKTWIGTVGDVLSGRAELAQTTGQVYFRNLVVGFSSAIVYEWLIFTTGEPLPSYSWKAVYWPFTRNLWLAVLGSLFVSLFSLKCLLHWNCTYSKATTCSHYGAFKKAGNYLLQTFLEQDATPKDLEIPTKSSTRVFLSFWLFFSLLITTSYRSKLVSFLAFPMVEEPPKTFSELAQSHHFEMALQYLRGAAHYLLRTSPNPVFQTIFKRMELEENDAKCFQRVIGKPFACISWDSVADFVTHKNLSDKYGKAPLVKAPDTTTFIAVGLIYPKRSVFRLKFDKVIATSHALGLVNKWKELDYEFIRYERRQWEKAENKTQVVYEDTTSAVLTMKQLSGTFFLLLVGTLVAVIAMVCETILGKVVFKNYQNLKQRNSMELLVRSIETSLHLIHRRP